MVCHCVLRGKVQCGLSSCFKKGKCSVVCHCGFKRISAVWSVIVF